MQFLRKTVSLLAISFALLPLAVSAHPLDISSSTFTLHETGLDGITYFHPSEVEAILGHRWLSMRALTYGDYYTYQQYLFDYLVSKVRFASGDNACKLVDFSTSELWVDEIFTAGFPVRYRVTCPGKIDGFKMHMEIFSELPLQTNRVLLYDGKTGNTVFYKVFTSKQTEYSYRPGMSTKLLDTDKDGLADEEESLYRTDISNPDTDGDFYTDYEEVMSGWNPISASVSPGQNARMEPSTKTFSLPTNIAQSWDGVAPGNYSEGVSTEPMTLSANDTGLYSILKKVLKHIDSLRTNGDDMTVLFPILWLLVVLGFLHALGPGHSKGFLVGYILAEGAGVWTSLLYALIFTLIHLADIAIITLLAKFVFTYFDPVAFLGRIELFWAIWLLALSLFLFATSVRMLRKKRVGLETVKPSRKGLWLAFFAGLAPCTFAWSIILVLFSIGRMEFALPFLLALWTGVFACLGTLALVTHKVREKIYGFDGRIAYYSPLVSSVFIFVLSAILLARFV